MGWIMDLLLLHRAFIVWNYHIFVILLMSGLYLSTVTMSIGVMVLAQRHAVFSHLGVQLAYLSLSVSTNIVFTLLVAGRLLAVRNRIVECFEAAALPGVAAAERRRLLHFAVVGGGATGAGVAVDAASRGLRVALVERDDFGSGACSALLRWQTRFAHRRA